MWPMSSLSGSQAVISTAIAAVMTFGCNRREKPTDVETTTQVPIYTNNGGTAYRAECETLGVPLPPTVLEPIAGWLNHGIITMPFGSGQFHAELWSWSTPPTVSPEGICLALARWSAPSYDTAELLDVICFGPDSSKACFFENTPDALIARNQAYPLSELAGGADLVEGSATMDPCTDCHAGENPFIIHPEKNAFRDLRKDRERLRRLQPASGWYEPIAPAGTPSVPWPHNPGPDTRLDAPPSSMGSCTECHKLPQVSTALSRYCAAVYTPATTFFEETMPLLERKPDELTYEQYRETFRNHLDALTQFCGQPPPETGGVIITGVPHVDDSLAISPLVVEGPIYACSQAVAVRGAVPHAEVELYWNSDLSATVIAGAGDVVELSLPGVVAENDILSARQIVDGTKSEFDDEVVIDYPYAELPKPIIDPTTVYACANSIAVLTTRGARLEASKNNGTLEVTFPADERAVMHPGPAPYDVGDHFVVRASLCQVRSDPSETDASDPPPVLRTPLFNPSPPYEGEEFFFLYGLDYGAFARVSLSSPLSYLGDSREAPTGATSWFSLPGSYLGRPLDAGESLTAEPSLYCPGAPSQPAGSTPPAIECSDLPAPVVAAPTEGQDYLSVLQALPGARIRVYDAANNEIADGAGTVVRLIPPRVFIQGEFIVVVQQAGTCYGTTGFRIGVGLQGGGGGE
jgi:hypothetical protein